jgi:predicted RNA methylase
MKTLEEAQADRDRQITDIVQFLRKDGRAVPSDPRKAAQLIIYALACNGWEVTRP